MIQYVVHVLPRIPIERWLILIVLLGVMLGGSWGYLCFTEACMRKSTARGWGVVCCVAADTALILWSTLFIRTPGTAHQANLIPLWSWYQGFIQDNDEIRWQIYFNILLFIPFGISLYLSKARPLWQILLRGFLLSLFIESCQVIFCLGLFEWDDLIHNSLGCLLGGYCGKVWENVWQLHRLHKRQNRNPRK